jgi:cytochrome c
MNHPLIIALATAAAALTSSVVLGADGNPSHGQRIFGACGACHSLEANRNMTGSSLAGLWRRKAGGVESFARYSPALKSSAVVWDDQTLDAWLHDPALFVPGNTMTFRGIADTQQRADLLAFLKEATKPDAPASLKQAQGAGMMGMMGGGRRSQFEEARCRGPGTVHRLLCRYLSSHNGRREDARVLGAQPPLQNR